MSWLPMYLLGNDVSMLIDHLDQDPELAWIVATGADTWRAEHRHPGTAAEKWCLWHIPSGELPLFSTPEGRVGWIENPWFGWANRGNAAVDGTPSFGAGHPGV